MEQLDILLDSSQELQVTATYDFKVGIADNNLIKYIVVASPGHYKTYPQVGVGIYNFINGNISPAEIERAIRLQLEADVFKKPDIDASRYPIIYVNKAVFNVT